MPLEARLRNLAYKMKENTQLYTVTNETWESRPMIHIDITNNVSVNSVLWKKL